MHSKVSRQVSNIGHLILILIMLLSLSCSKKEGSPRSEPAPSSRKMQEEHTVESFRVPDSEMTAVQGKEVNQMAETKNLPPRIKKIKLLPEVFKPGDTLYVDVEADDPDGDEVTISYEWYKHGELVSTERQLNSTLKRGDKLVVKIKPYDGKDYGKEVILNREILNLPPVITDHKEYHLDKDTFTYRVKASDPDGDPLTYFLKSAPPGMTIDPNGLIKWDIPPDFKGKASVTVSVTDGQGGEAIYSFEVTFGFEGR